MMRSGLELSLGAVDIVCEDLRLGTLPYPLMVPHTTRSLSERAHVRQLVHRDFVNSGLLRSGGYDPALIECLRLVVDSPRALSLTGFLADGSELCARVAGGKHAAVRVVISGQHLRIEPVASGALEAALVELIPATPAGIGQSMNFPAESTGEEHGSTILRAAVQPVNRDVARAGQLARATKRSLGVLTAHGHGSHGRLRSSTPLTWFDVAAG
ncbi:MAG: ESX secretion-associated protein EspG, partial [Sciscionella sp.]